MVWVADYDFDGFRHDATKHIDELYWRKLTRKIKEAKLDRRIYQIGETYGSPELINSYVSNGMLDAQFDFNVYDAAVSAFVNEDASSVENLVTTLKQSWNTYGYHNLMGYISGNQDRSRFITLASGDIRMDEDQKLAGWTRDIPKPQPTAYRQLATLHALNFAIPGIPVIYYGDEYGMWGANDPDNRKMMKFTGYDADEAALRADVEALAAARAREMALLYGETEIEITHENVIHITRSYLGDQIQIWINPGSAPVPCAASTEHILAGHLVEGEGGNLLEAHSFVYVKE
jgi:glycosidase